MREISVTPSTNGKLETIGPIRDWAVNIIVDTPQPAIVYYTTDGATPTEDSASYNGDLIVGGTDVLPDTGLVPLRFLIQHDGDTKVGYPIMFIFDRHIPLKASAPFGTYAESQEVTLATCNGSMIYYTLNGTSPITIEGNPSETAVRYAGPIEVNNTMLKAVAIKYGMFSSMLQGEYKIGEVALEVCASHDTGSYDEPIAVRLTTNTDDSAAIRYTLDGSNPLGERAEIYDHALILGNDSAEVLLRAVATTDKQQSLSINNKYNFKE